MGPMNPFLLVNGRIFHSSLRRSVVLCRVPVVLSARPTVPTSQKGPRDHVRSYHTTTKTLADAAVAPAGVDSAAVTTTEAKPPILWTTHRLNKESIAKVERLFHKLLWLDMFETSMLNDIINDRMNLVLTARQRKQLSQLMEARAADGTSASTGASDAAPEAEAGPVLVDLKLAKFDAAAKIKVIKEVRSILGLGLKEAKEMVESAPVVLQKGLKPEAAEEWKAKLEAVGATVELS